MVVGGAVVVVGGAGVGGAGVGTGVGESPHRPVVGVSDENPGGHKQSVHCAAPPAADMPTPQSSQSARVSVAPAGAAVPTRQVVSEHWVFPPGENWPALHSLQFSRVLLEPVPLDDWPGRHVMPTHGVAAPGLNRPGSQGAQSPRGSLAPAGLALPAGQVVGAHWSSLPLENWPCGQILHVASGLDAPICSTWTTQKKGGISRPLVMKWKTAYIYGRRSRIAGHRLALIDVARREEACQARLAIAPVRRGGGIARAALTARALKFVVA